MPVSVQRDACLIRLGLQPGGVEWDHDPALELRRWNDAVGDYDPPANDPRFIVPRTPEDHRAKTTGRRGESDLSLSFNGDQSRIAKGRRLEKAAEEARRRMLAKEPGRTPEKRGTIPGRSFRPAAAQRTASRPIERNRP